LVLGLTYSGTVLTNLILPSAFTYVSHIFTPSNLVTWTTHIFSTIIKFLDKIYTYGNKKNYVSVYFRTYTSLGLLSYRCWPRPPVRALVLVATRRRRQQKHHSTTRAVHCFLTPRSCRGTSRSTSTSLLLGGPTRGRTGPRTRVPHLAGCGSSKWPLSC
jgi:hypothetical protein